MYGETLKTFLSKKHAIHSSGTTFYKTGAPIIIWIWVAFVVVACIFISISIETVLVIALHGLGGIFIQYMGFHIKKVFVADNGLVIVNYSSQIVIPYTDIDDVVAGPFSMVRIKLKRNTRFGDHIDYAPKAYYFLKGNNVDLSISTLLELINKNRG
jgi:hypothetical protein